MGAFPPLPHTCTFAHCSALLPHLALAIPQFCQLYGWLHAVLLPSVAFHSAVLPVLAARIAWFHLPVLVMDSVYVWIPTTPHLPTTARTRICLPPAIAA